MAPKIVIRSAYGVFFADRAPNDYFGDPSCSVGCNGWGWGVSNVVNNPGNLAPAFNWDNGYPGVATFTTPNPSQADNKSGALYWPSNAGRLGYTQSWNFNIQRDLPFSMVLDAGYVGTKGTALMANGLGVLNQLPPSALVLGSLLTSTVTSQAALPASAVALGARYPFGATGKSIPVWQTLTPFPQLLNGATVGAWNAPLGFSTYNALQVQLNKRFSRGLSWLANYTLSKSLANVTNTYSGGTGTPMIAYNLSLQKAIVSYDQTHVVKIGLTYELPVGRGKALAPHMHPVLNAMLGGWKIQYIGNYNSGTPLSFGANSAASGTNVGGNRALLTNGDAGLGDSVQYQLFQRRAATGFQHHQPVPEYPVHQAARSIHLRHRSGQRCTDSRIVGPQREHRAAEELDDEGTRSLPIAGGSAQWIQPPYTGRNLDEPEQHHVRRRDLGERQPHHAARDPHRFLRLQDSHRRNRLRRRRVEKTPWRTRRLKAGGSQDWLPHRFFIKFRGPKAHANRQRISGKRRRKFMSVPSLHVPNRFLKSCVRIVATVPLPGKSSGEGVGFATGWSEVSREDALAQLDRIVDSPPFRSSKRCSLFLRYVVQHAIDNEVDCLKERTLGVAVFDRDPHYDTNQDPIVRTTAGEVRKRLAQYYLGPAHENELRISLPTGAYLPEVHAVPSRPETKIESIELPPTPVNRGKWWVGAAIAGAAAALAGGYSLISRKTELDQFWAPFIKAQGPVVMCVGQPQAYNFVSDTQRALDDWFASGDGKTEPPPEIARIPLPAIVPMWDRYTGFGDAQALARISSVFGAYGKKFQVRGGKSASLADLRGKPAHTDRRLQQPVDHGSHRGAALSLRTRSQGRRADRARQPESRTIRTGKWCTRGRTGGFRWITPSLPG